MWLYTWTGVHIDGLQNKRNFLYNQLDFFENDPYKLHFVRSNEFQIVFTAVCLVWHFKKSENDNSGINFIMVLLMIFHTIIYLLFIIYLLQVAHVTTL